MPRDFFAQGRSARALLCLLLAAAAAACVLLGRGGEASGLIDPEQLEESAFSVPAPAFSVPSGFYAEPLTLFLSVPEGTAVYYTLDCSDPNEKSIPYVSPLSLTDASRNENVYSLIPDAYPEYITGEYALKDPDRNVDKCNVVRAVAVTPGGSRSEVVTGVYFVGIDPATYDGCRILSVVTDPDNLFDSERGIYVMGDTYKRYLLDHPEKAYPKADGVLPNFAKRGRTWERRANLHLFCMDGKPVTEAAIGLRSHGSYSRYLMPRGLNLYAKTAGGIDGVFSAPVTCDENYLPDAVVLFAGGNELVSYFPDRMMTDRTAGAAFATATFSPTVLFLEGEYWGFYYLTEKMDARWLSNLYGVDEDNILLIKEGSVESGKGNLQALYDDMLTTITSMDLGDPAEYERACRIIDIDSYLDYYAVQFYIARTADWPVRNEALWRAVVPGDGPYEDGKWRWILFDVNAFAMTENLVAWNNLSNFLFEEETYNPLFDSFWRNETFRELFRERLMDVADTYFAPDEMNAYIDAFIEEMTPRLSKCFARFYGSDEEMLKAFREKMESFRYFFDHRREYVERWEFDRVPLSSPRSRIAVWDD